MAPVGAARRDARVNAAAGRPASLASMLARLAWADVLERTRQPGFLISLAVMAYLAHGMLPPQGAPYRTFVIDESIRPEYGSAWVGTLVALLTGLYFLMVGFYLVKGSIERDRRTGVGAILGASRLSAFAYVCAKAASHVIVLMAMAMVAALMGLVAQQLHGENRHVDVIALLWPLAWIALPVAMFVAAGAVLWECTPGLRSGIGNVAWFFFFTFIVSFSAVDDGSKTPFADLPGGRVVASSLQPAIRAAFPDSGGTRRPLGMGVNVNEKWRGQRLATFAWRGMELSPAQAASRFFWAFIALGMLGLATIPFDRFAHAATAVHHRPLAGRWPWSGPQRPALRAAITSASHLSPVRRAAAFAALVRAELALQLHGQPVWWWLGLVGMLIAQAFSPLAVVRTVLMPITSFWPAFVWSALGHRERRLGTAGFLFSTPRPRGRLLMAAGVAAAMVFVLAGATGLLRLASAGDGAAIAGWFAGAVFVSGLALAMGEWTGNAKLFEVALLFLWYVGPMHQIASLDYTGVTAPRAPVVTATYGAIGAVGVVLAWMGRRREWRR